MGKECGDGDGELDWPDRVRNHDSAGGRRLSLYNREMLCSRAAAVDDPWCDRL